jgi:hypothetical protein
MVNRLHVELKSDTVLDIVDQILRALKLKQVQISIFTFDLEATGSC